MVESYPTVKKTMWEKEKLLVTSNFSFNPSVFRRLLLQTHENQGLFGKGLNLFPKDKHSDSFKLKATADHKSIVTQKLRFIFL